MLIGLTVKPKIEECVRIGQEAWKRLTSCEAWNDWLLVGEALAVGRVQAMQSAHTNKPEGRRYNEEFGDWLKANKFDGIHKTTRSQLFKCLEHRAEVETWRATLTTSERLNLNPVAILRRWQKVAIKKTNAAAPKKPSHVEKLNASLIQLEEENARMKREIEHGGGDLWTPQDTPKDIARIIFTKVSRSKARDVARELNRLAREVEKTNAAQVTVEVHA